MADETRITAEPGARTLVMTRSFDAPRARVFEAWTRAEHVKHWWDPSGVPLEACEIDLRPNGTFRWVNRGHAFTGTYREITPPERVVFVSGESLSDPDSVSTLHFVEKAGKTVLTITIECRTGAGRDALLKMGIDKGTVRTLANLAGYLRKTA